MNWSNTTRNRRLLLILAASVLVISLEAVATEPHDQVGSSVSYHQQIRPIFQVHCFGCHQPAKAGGDYVMTSFKRLLQGGESEQPAIRPGNTSASHLIDQITVHEGAAEMPKNAPPLSQTDIDLITDWIASGAPDDSPVSTAKEFDREHPPQYGRPPIITALDISPDGRWLAVSGYHEVLIHDLDGSEQVARLIGQAERIESVRFSPDGQRIAVAGGIPAQMGEIQIWDVRGIRDSTGHGELLVSQPVTFDSVFGVSWSPDGSLIGFGCTDATVRAIDTESGEEVLFQGAHDDWVLDTAFSTDGSHLVSVGRDMTAKLTEIATQRFIDNITSITPKALKGGIQAAVRHPLRDEIVFGGADGVPKIYQMYRTTKRQIGDDANLLWELSPLPGRIFDIDVSADGQRIVAASSLNGKGHVRLYAMESSPVIPAAIQEILKKPTHERSKLESQKLQAHFRNGVQVTAALDFDCSIYAVVMAHDASRVFAGGTDGLVKQIDSSSGQLLREFSPVPLAQDESTTDVAAESDPLVEVEAQELHQNRIDLTEPSVLEMMPQDVSFSHTAEYAQAVVTARLRSGKTVDVTRNVIWTSSDPSVEISPAGLIRPVSDGNATLTAQLGQQVAECRVAVAGLQQKNTPDFVQDVNPILTKAGCNGGTCHGSQDGKNGFKLSLRGYDPLHDVRALADDLGSRRVNLAAPDRSMMLRKPSAAVPHEGGQVIRPGGGYYQILRDWIAGGALLDPSSRRVQSLAVFPANPVVEEIGSSQQVRVIALYDDGRQRDVTREAFIESGNTDVVVTDTDDSGLVHTLRRGEAALLIRYEGAYATTILTVMGNREGFVWKEQPAHNRIDELVATKLKRTKTLAAPTCDDYTFLRRVSLDLTGLPPTPDQVQKFAGDKADSTVAVDVAKRNAMIDQLIGSQAFVDHWTNKWADLLQVNGRYLGSEGALALRNWIRDHVEANTPYDRFVQEILTASGSTEANPAATYYKIHRSPQDLLENTTHLFLATRFNCNKCHDHPFERWTQDQYYQLGAFFAQVGRKADPRVGDKEVGETTVEAGKPLQEVVFDLGEGELRHDRTGEVASPKFPYSLGAALASGDSRRSRLAAWITSPANPYFARSYVNRLWGYLTGRGIIEPIDDIRAGNPPTNPELLDYLTREFIDSGFDARHLLRLICQSRTYQLSVETNRWNEDDPINYSHAIPRRLSAESLYDAIHIATGATSRFPDLPEGLRAAALPDAAVELPDEFLGKFGRPARESACECERTSGMQLGPVIALINGPTVGNAIREEQNEVARIAREATSDAELIGNLYFRVLSRPVSATELEAAEPFFAEIDRDHARLVATLRAYEADVAPKLAALAKLRKDQLARASRAVTDYEEQLAPRRAELETERSANLLRIEQELSGRRSEIENALPEWEQTRRDESRWIALDPIYMVSSNDSPLTREADLKIYGEPRGNDAVYQIVARAPLPQITGLRIDAFADKRLRKGGPGNGFDGNYVLTELEAAHAPISATPPIRYQHWDFASNDDSWSALVDCDLTQEDGVLTVTSKSKTPSMVAEAQAPAGKFALELVADVEKYATIEVLWKTHTDTEFGHDRKAELRVVEGGDGFRRYLVFFEADSPITGLRIDPSKRATTLRLDSISLLKLPKPEFADVTFTTAEADFSEEGYHVRTAIDGKTPNVGNGWGIAPQMNQDHTAVFAIDGAIGDGTGLFRITMKHFYRSKEHQLALFRLSVTNDTRPISMGLPDDIGRIVDIAPVGRSDEQLATLLNYLYRRDNKLREIQKSLDEASKPIPPDAKLVELKAEVARLSEPLSPDPKLARLQRATELSEKQVANRRLTAAQDLVWALINSPAFLYNH